jgi:hypothetical protein
LFLKKNKYRELELDERSGKLRYQTQIHAGVIPSNIENDGKTIIVSKDFFLRNNGSKQKRQSTPSDHFNSMIRMIKLNVKMRI